MIKIQRDLFPPEIRYKTGRFKGLLKWRVVETKMLSDYKSNPLPFIEGTYQFPRLPCYKEFRDELLRAQGKKCCFCEKPVEGCDIEHFRPKSAWQEAVGNPFNRPGYFWLAYRWSNLVISCSDCNRSGQKGSLFPINGVRANFSNRGCVGENCTLINPVYENPTLFISFNEDVPAGVDENGRGEKNIAIFKLRNRADLRSIRKDRFDKYKLLSELGQLDIGISSERLEEATRFVREAQKPKAPFAGMISENIKKGRIKT